MGIGQMLAQKSFSDASGVPFVIVIIPSGKGEYNGTPDFVHAMNCS